jgi:hypothetical protein
MDGLERVEGRGDMRGTQQVDESMDAIDQLALKVWAGMSRVH